MALEDTPNKSELVVFIPASEIAMVGSWAPFMAAREFVTDRKKNAEIKN